jgi:hypothetical protein
MVDTALIEIIDELDFEVAFRHLKYDAQYDFIQMPVELAIFERFSDENIALLKDAVRQGTYSISGLRKIWVPKKNFFLRPGSIPILEDRLIFQALVDSVAPNLEKLLPPFKQGVVFSARLNSSLSGDSMFLPLRDLWISFKKRAIQFCKEPGVTHVLATDISSYFQNIDLGLLVSLLTSAGIRPSYVRALEEIIKKWANGRSRGLPQMLAPCSLLANIYLSQVDKNMILRGYKYIRYVDDIRIFVSSNAELRKALIDLTEELRQFYLDLQASKTIFYTNEDHISELTLLNKHMEENGIDDINEQDALSYFEPSATRTPVPEENLLRFLHKILRNEEYDDRDLRYCVNNLGRIMSPAAIDLVISKLYTMPQETYTFVQYLLHVPKSYIAEEIIDRIIKFLESDWNLYDWQMMWLLLLLSNCENLTDNHLQSIMLNEKLQHHPINRALSIYILCVKGGSLYQRKFIHIYRREQSKEVRMAILSGVYHLNKAERDPFYDLAGGDRQIDQLLDMLAVKKIEFC